LHRPVFIQLSAQKQQASMRMQHSSPSQQSMLDAMATAEALSRVMTAEVLTMIDFIWISFKRLNVKRTKPTFHTQSGGVQISMTGDGKAVTARPGMAAPDTCSGAGGSSNAGNCGCWAEAQPMSAHCVTGQSRSLQQLCNDAAGTREVCSRKIKASSNRRKEGMRAF
jgi:hypothetical protein